MKAQRVTEARIQKAVSGFSIPMMSIPTLYAALSAAITAGKTDDDLQAVVSAFPGVNRG